jgi:hypothetical protein
MLYEKIPCLLGREGKAGKGRQGREGREGKAGKGILLLFILYF